jgi:hypothetical protein
MKQYAIKVTLGFTVLCGMAVYGLAHDIATAHRASMRHLDATCIPTPGKAP